jgi:prolyl-tRNA editing enzyme YbaK/EbsC (Cys-tRNA(Pro) deacylase)
MLLHPSAQKVVEAAAQLGLEIAVTEFAQGTRTAVDAANAIGCTVGQIVKSLCFTVGETPVMALVSGENQLDERKLAAAFGVGRKRVKRADAEMVKAATGYAIGGVPPFGHLQPMTVFVDNDLAQYDIIWAAAGTPYAVFPLTPGDLTAVSGGSWLDLKR